MLAAAEEPPFAAVKSVGLSPRNGARGLPSVGALITLFDSQTGLPLAVMDGDWITGVRTAALSALAAKYLARPESSAIAFIGCGVQARCHLDAFAEMFPLREVRAFGRGAASRDALCDKAVGMGLEAIASPTACEALEGADLVVTSVPDAPGFEPFLDAAWLATGAFASLTDLARAWLPDGFGALDRVVIDDAEQESRAARPMVEPSLVGGDLAELVTGRCPARRSPAERIVFVFRGIALGDLALAALAYRAARDRGLGQLLPA